MNIPEVAILACWKVWRCCRGSSSTRHLFESAVDEIHDDENEKRNVRSDTILRFRSFVGWKHMQMRIQDIVGPIYCLCIFVYV